MTIAVFAGTFDPFTNGHFNIVVRAMNMFDDVYILIGNNPAKVPTFNRKVRAEHIKYSIRGVKNVHVAIASQRALVDDLQLLKANVLIKGIRNSSDLEYEGNMEDINREICPQIGTVYFRARPDLAHISSSAFKEIIALGKSGRWMVDNHIQLAYKENIYEDNKS